MIKRTLMLQNRELLDFEIDTRTGTVRILDAPDADDALLASMGFDGPDREDWLLRMVSNRAISSNRDDIAQILAAFDACSPVDLVFRGRGLSLTDHLWYRAPGSIERWEDINFFDNAWDGAFGESVLRRDYTRIASCSLDTPDITTVGLLRKAWERTESGVFLIKEPLFKSGVDLEGALLAAELCRLLYGEDTYQPLEVIERFGRRFSASPLMITRDEELVQGYRLFALGGFDMLTAREFMGITSPQSFIDSMARVGVVDATADVAKKYAFKALALLADAHAGNFGVVRNVETGVCRSAPSFDYDRAFGFPEDGPLFEFLCENPALAVLLCAKSFSDLDPSWDWTWYDPQVLEGFEDRIVEAYAPYHDLPANLAELVASLFVMQRDYVNEIASGKSDHPAPSS